MCLFNLITHTQRIFSVYKHIRLHIYTWTHVARGNFPKKVLPDCIHSTISKQQKLEDVEQQRKRGVPLTQEISNRQKNEQSFTTISMGIYGSIFLGVANASCNNGI